MVSNLTTSCEAAEAALAAKALDLAAGDNDPAVDLTEQDTPCEDQPNNVEPEKREVCVLSSDLDAIFAIVDEVDARGPGSRPSDDVFGGQFDVDMVRTQTAKTSNPFAAHKRAAPSAAIVANVAVASCIPCRFVFVHMLLRFLSYGCR